MQRRGKQKTKNKKRTKTKEKKVKVRDTTISEFLTAFRFLNSVITTGASFFGCRHPKQTRRYKHRAFLLLELA